MSHTHSLVLDIPNIGLGTFKIKGNMCVETVTYAIKLGYRLIDTARCYRNESDIGIAIQTACQNFNIKREELFIVSKIPPNEHGEDVAYNCVIDTLKNLNVNYLDLMLIHWPGVSKQPPESPEHSKMRNATYKGLIRAKNEKLVRHIGVSNFILKHLQELIHEYPNDIPYLNQVECHPMCNQLELRNFCFENSIKFQAYSSLGSSAGNGKNPLTEHSLVQTLALKYSVTVPELLLLWALQQNPYRILIIPKTKSHYYLEQNLMKPWENLLKLDKSKMFDSSSTLKDTYTMNNELLKSDDSSQQQQQRHVTLLSSEDFEKLNNINSQGINDEIHFCWNPSKVH